MRIAYVNQDPGVGPGRSKGAAIHVAVMRAAFEELGHQVMAFDEPDEGALLRRLRESGQSVDVVYERYALGKDVVRDFANKRGIPHVLEVNAPLAEEAARWRQGGDEQQAVAKADRRLFQEADLVLCVSNLVAKYASSRGARPEAVSVVGNAVDRRRFFPRDSDSFREEFVPEDTVVLCFHGRLRPWHNFFLFARAAGILVEEGHPVHILCVGRGDFESELGGYVPEENRTCVPWVSHDEVASYVASADVLPLTYSSETPCYFSPLKLAEAMACGVVPVVPRLGDLTTVVADGVSGLCYEPDDVVGLCAALRQLITDSGLRRRLGEGAAQHAGPSWTSVADQALHAIRSHHPRVPSADPCGDRPE